MLKIEIFIPAYNCAKTLPKTLSSLMAQTDPNFSVCIVDDCGKDSVEDICKNFPTLNLRIVKNEKNLGCGLSRQHAIDTSDADYLIPLDSDDMLLPMAIDVMRKSALMNPSADYFIGHVMKESLDKNGDTVYNILTNDLTIIASKMYKKSFLDRFNIRNCEEFSRFADDTYFNILSYELGEKVFIPFPLYFYARNPNSVTNKNDGRDYWNGVVPKFLRCIQRTTEKIIEYKPISEITHLPGTLRYIKTIIQQRNDPNELECYQELEKILEKMGFNKIV